MDQITEVMRFIGLPPAQAATGLVLAVLLRYLRGMVHWFTSELTYLAAIAFAVVGALLDSTGGDWRPVARETLILTAFVLIMQKVLEVAASKFAWLPQDNEWVKPSNLGGK